MRYPEILSIRPDPVNIDWDEQRTMLYAVGLGAGADEADLPFVYEKGLKALPTMAAMLAGGSGDFFRLGAIDMVRLMHGEQRVHLHRPLPPAGRFRVQVRCLGVVDKGTDKGALLTLESAIADAASGEALATATSTLFCRGDGGCGAPSTGGLPERPVPSRPHDLEVALPTLPQQAAIYRLSGDRTDFHIDPAAARRSGFPRPILHGLCTWGIVGRAVLRGGCENDPDRVEALEGRFSAPVFPGETIVTRLWLDGPDVAFEARVAGRETVVLKNGYCRLRTIASSTDG